MINLRTPTLFLLLMIPFLGCSRGKSILDRADELSQQGRYELALPYYYKFEKEDSPVGRSMAGIGRILSTSRMSVFAGLNLLEDSLKMKEDETVRTDLFYLYLDLGRFSRAREMLSAESIGLDLYYRPRYELLRKSLECYFSTRPQALISLIDFDPSGERDHGLVRCYLNQKKWDQLNKTLTSMGERGKDLWYCRSLAVLTAEGENFAPYKEDHRSCMGEFPGDPVLRRSRPLIVEGETEDVPGGVGLFEEKMDLPPYTEHSWHPYWKTPL